MAHSNLYRPLDPRVRVCQILAILAFLANPVVQGDPLDLVYLAVLVGHFDLASLVQVNLVNQAFHPPQVVQLALAVQEALYLPVVLVALVAHSIQVFQCQAILWVQLVPGALGALCDQAVLACPSLCLLLVLVILEVQEDLCDLVLLWPLVDPVIPVHLVYLFRVTQVGQEDPVGLAVQVALVHPLGPFLLVVRFHHYLLACQAVLVILVFQFQEVLVDQKVQVFPKVLVDQFLEAQVVLQVLQALAAQQDPALLGEFPQLLCGLSDL